MQTRDQQLATAVYTCITRIGSQNETYRNKYGSMAHKLPVLIRTAGLAQALTFVQARGESPHQELLTHLAEVMNMQDGAHLAAQSRRAELREYMYLTQQALAALLWYKRFAQSVLGVAANEEEHQ
jgi:CRISPR-associated protein Cmr5